MMIIVLLVFAAAAAVLGGAYYAYRIAFFSPKKGRDTIPQVNSPEIDRHRDEIRRTFRQLENRPCEFVTITSFDGLILSGRYYHTADGAPLSIGFHGYRSSYLTDFCGGSDILFQLGHNLLLIDQRAHGRSQGSTISFGLRERQDVLSWISWSLDRFGAGTKIVLYGVSMGASTVLMASGLPLPENVKGIVADCPYSSPLDIILHVGKSNPVPDWLIRPFAILGAKIFGGFDLTETTAAEAVSQAQVPILIIHGEADTFVPTAMSDLTIKNPNLIRRFTFPNAGHALSYLEDTPRYRSIVSGFISHILRD